MSGRLRLTLALAALAGGAPLAAQSSGSASRLAGRVPAAALPAIDSIIATAVAESLPSEPLVQKALEGSAKGIPADRLVSGVRRGLQAAPHAAHETVGGNAFGAAFQRLLHEWLARQTLGDGGSNDRIDRRQSGSRYAAGEPAGAAAALRGERSPPRECGERQGQAKPTAHGCAAEAAGRTINSEFSWPAPKPSST